MEKSNKLYLKALNKYQSGYIDQAIEICEESISINMNNTASISLKGLLYYLKGDIDSAKALWKLNYEVNEDEVSRKYLQGLNEDERKLALYTKAVGLIKKLNIKEALGLLMECKESDYNCINVNNAIAACYVKHGQYEKAVPYVNEVLKIDMKNDVALMNRKELIKYGVRRKSFVNKPFKKNGKIIAAVALIMFCILIGKYGMTVMKKVSFNNEKIKASVKNQKYVDKKEIVDKKTDVSKNIQLTTKEADNNKINTKTEKKQEEVFPHEDIKKSLGSKEYYKLHGYVSKWKKTELKINDKILLSQCEEVLKKEGVKYFYTKGSEFLVSSKEYKNTIDNLSKAYLYGKDNYLYQDIVYMLGVAYEKGEDNEKALKYYSEYDIKFPKGSYEAEVLYRLTLIYKDVNLNKSKEYAIKLVNNYSASQYNNSIIKNIINKQ
ncbi:tetratricopeptide repeat protein [Clostridium sp. ZS2-4]|uniref:tetratricopeptide repeat protein n=1 Tax=Clostridium sp. ZS2-4 TaxID=2987703 RepID=UPI00227B407E|nr:tetratricopeptide repeat protein [Clostridium sp. ZS2-4]MCY6354671.1 tetratricopeptide repeat protein [Clostridium sp. ZS2-4]